jgi:hypothetical protein
MTIEKLVIDRLEGSVDGVELNSTAHPKRKQVKGKKQKRIKRPHFTKSALEEIEIDLGGSDEHR